MLRNRQILVGSIVLIALLAMTVPADAQRRGNRSGGDDQAQGQQQQDDIGRRGRGNRGGRGGGTFGGRGGGFGGFGRGGLTGFNVEQDFLRRDVPLFIEELQLDDSQRVIFEMLFTDYEATYQELRETYQTRQGELAPRLAPEAQRAQEAIQEQINELNTERRRIAELLPEGSDRDQVNQTLQNRINQLREESRTMNQEQRSAQADQGVFDAIARIQAEWTLMNGQLRDEFVGNVMATLTSEQQSNWPALERRLRREKTLSDGRLSGERVNLFSVLRDQQLPADLAGSVQPLLDEYDIMLDDALKRRNDYLETSNPKLMQAYQEMDYDRGLGIVNQQTALRTAVRDVNDNYSQMLTSALPESEASGFRDAYRRNAYPRIFRTTRAERALVAAKELVDLLPETLEAIVQLEAAYLLELAAINERLVMLTKRHEPNSTRQNAEWMVARARGEDVDRPEDPVRNAYDDREELDDRYISTLRSLLTPEQQEALPNVDRRRGRGGRGGGNADVMAQFDRDGDGELSRAEREAAREAFEQIRRGGGGRRGGG